VARDELVSYDAVEVPSGRLHDALRSEQDALAVAPAAAAL
jgi:hypothetical protein